MTAICVPIFLRDPGAALVEAATAAEAGADLVELRADEADAAAIGAAVRGSPLPTIVTIRAAYEGGRCTLDDAARAPLFAAAAEAGAAYLDCELAAFERTPALRDTLLRCCRQPEHGTGPHLIISSHDFAGRPADLPALLARLAAVRPASIAKLAFLAGSLRDAADALALMPDFRRRHGMELLALAMGPFGQITRLLAPKYGAPLTFATVAAGGESAPGQPTVRELVELYRFREQKPSWPVYGVVGWPVGHSLSPHVHNAGFAHLGHAGVYVPLPIAPTHDEFCSNVDALRACPGLDLRGLSVTIPHKEHALTYARAHGAVIDELSARIGAVNTLAWQPDGTLVATNSDYAGALDALTDALGTGRAGLAGRSAAVLGAGGGARAIVAGLAASGARVTIYNRTVAKAAELAAGFAESGVQAAPLDAVSAGASDIYINCTSLGMHPKVEGCPVPEAMHFTPQAVVFDTVYTPRDTLLLRRAAADGARTIPGLEMFVRQAAVQFELFTGRSAPVDTFRRVMTGALAARG